LAAVKLTTVHVTEPTGMICPAKPVWTEDLYTVHKEEFSIMCCMCAIHTLVKGQETNTSSCQTGYYIKILTPRVQLQNKRLFVILKGLDDETN
jgi:hypothetical protein